MFFKPTLNKGPIDKSGNLLLGHNINGRSKQQPFPTAGLSNRYNASSLKLVEGTYYLEDLKGDKDIPFALISGILGEVADYLNSGVLSMKTPIVLTPPVGIPDANNGFFYTGGTPNELYPQNFFSDIDFEHKIFVKYKEQELDGNGVEISPAGITDIFVYSEPLEGTNLQKMQIFCNVPAFDSESVLVDGNISISGDGSFLNPYKTIDDAIQNSVDGSNIYVRSGIYNEATSGYNYLRLTINKNLSVTGIGFAELQSSDATELFVNTLSASYKVNWYNFNFVGKRINSTNPFIINNSYVGTSINFSNISMNGCIVNYPIAYSGQGVTNSVVLRTATYRGDKTIEYNLFITSSENGLYYNDTFLNTTESYIQFNKFKTNNSSCIRIGGVDLNNNSLDLYIINNYFEVYGTTTNGPIRSECSDLDATFKFNLQIRNNNFIDNLNNLGILCYGVSIAGVASLYNNIDISENYFLSENTANRRSILFSVTDAITGKITTNKNRFFQDSFEGYGISFGETGAVEWFDDVEVIGNYFRGCLFKYPTQEATTTHGFLVSGGINHKIEYNYCEYTSLAYVIKTGTRENTSNGFCYNIGFNCDNHLYIRESVGVKVYNNSFINSDNFTPQTGMASFDVGSIGGTNQKIKLSNNIWYDAHSIKTRAFFVDVNGLTGTDPINFDNDIFYIPNYTYLIINNNVPVDNYTLAQAITNGWVVNEITDEPLFTDLTTGILTLETGSAGLGVGKDLGVDYDTGLDPVSDWNRDDESYDLVEITTKQQDSNWDCGAYVN